MTRVPTTIVLLLLVMCCDTVSAVAEPCPDTMSLTGNVCAAIHTDSNDLARVLNFAGGNFNCEELFHTEAHFPHIETEEENQQFIDLRATYPSSAANPLEGEEEEMWLNLKCNTVEEVWQWQDDGSDVAWSNWEADSDASCTATDTALCAVIKADGQWGRRSCLTEALVICQLATYSYHCADGCGTGTCDEDEDADVFKCTCSMNTYGDSCSESCGGAVFIDAELDMPSGASCTWEYNMPIPFFKPTVILSGDVDCEDESLNIYSATDDALLHGPLCGDVTGTYTGTENGQDLYVVVTRNDANRDLTIKFFFDDSL